MTNGSVRLLLSGASSTAIIAALAASPALAAGQNFGPGNVPPIVISADTDFVHVNDATVQADALGNALIIQSGVTIDYTAGTALRFDDSIFQGSVTNNGNITSHGPGWYITDSTIIGNLENHGDINGGGSGEGDGLLIGNTIITGSIINTGTILGAAKGATGVVIGGSKVLGDVVNSGDITGGTGIIANGLDITASTIGGAIRNQTGGKIVGGDADDTFQGNGISIAEHSIVSGGIFNDGSIGGGIGGSFRSGISIDGSTVSGGIHNTGSIRGGSNSAAISIIGGTFSGGIESSNWISSAIDANAIVVNGTTFGGGIHNSQGGSIQANGTGIGIYIGIGTTFGGGILNEGHIESGGGDAIRVSTTNFGGTLNNAGVISGLGPDSVGIRVDGFIASGIVNSGTIEAPVAIDIAGAAAGQTITQTGGKILGDIMFSGNGASYFVGTGGYFFGDMEGTNSDNDDITVKTGTWSAEGTGSGLGSILVSSGTGVFGGRFRGDLFGIGFVVEDTTDFGTTAGRAHIDDDSNINVGDVNLGGEGSLEFLLTSNTMVHGRITAELFATLGGRLATYLDWNSFAGKGATQDFDYSNVVQSTNDLIGAFANEDDVDTNSVFFEATATQRSDRYVDIHVHRVGFDEIVPNPSANQQAVGNALEEIYANGGAPFLALEDPNGDDVENPQEDSEGLFSALFQLTTAGEVGQAYGSLDGHNNAAIFQTAFTIADLMDRNIQSRLEDVRDAQDSRSAGEPVRYAAATITAVDAASGVSRASSGWSAWARAFGSWGNADGEASNEGFDQDSRGFGFGVDYAPGRNSLIGISGQFANTNVEFDRPAWAPIGADADIASWQVAIYGYHSFGTLFIDGNASATFNDNTSRRVDFWGQPIQAEYDSTVYSVYGELGADLNSGRFNIQPYAGVGFRHADFDNFVERCPLFCLAIAPDDAESLYSALGVRASATYRWGRTPITPEVRLAWQHEFSDDRGAFDAAFVGAPGSPFHVEGQRFAEDKVIVGAGISAEVSRNFSLFAEYNGSFSSDFEAHSIAGGLRVTW